MRTFVCREGKHVEAAKAFIDSNWRSMANTKYPLQIDFKPEAKRRSIQANRYYWQILNQIATDGWIEGTQYSAECWHEAAKRRFIGFVDVPGGGLMSMSTTDLSTKEFAEYVTKVEAWAATELGITFTERENAA